MKTRCLRILPSCLMGVVCCAVILAPSLASETNLVLNPSFESNTASATTFNMSNATVTSKVANVTGFGVGNEIDLTELGGDPFYGVPEDGNWFLNLHTRPTLNLEQDAFSIQLSSPLVSGALYDLAFFATGLGGHPAGVDVGVSTVANSFGDLVFSSTNYNPTISSWTQLSTTFSAPTNATYLTVRSSAIPDAIASVDNFSLSPVPEPSSLAIILAGGIAAMVSHCRRRRLDPSARGRGPAC